MDGALRRPERVDERAGDPREYMMTSLFVVITSAHDATPRPARAPNLASVS